MRKKNRAAILTWWHYRNYGTVLQLTALFSVVQSLGYRVDVVDYIPSGKRYSTKSDLDSLSYKPEAERVVDEKRDRKFDDYLAKHFSISVSDKPSTADIPPAGALAIHSPRKRTRLTAVEKSNTPAQTNAEYSPNE